MFKAPTYSTNDKEWGTPEQLDAHFAQCCPYVRDSAKLMWRHVRWPMYDREPISDWVKGRIALLGDAAHPMFQYIAQGACQAIEDGYTFAREVTTTSDPAQGSKPIARRAICAPRASNSPRARWAHSSTSTASTRSSATR